ncbi:nuclear serine protease HtrA2/Nma111 [Blastomyces gilchristii SLH14081]|uniref:Nuclear serine protease HtrA2/Nma111 n=1 Tax=Blastomyces gilchristii (strain SLH14081) TaxID=559298 RepID=A0A179UYN3_BLAGS|nr:nuclear serine protease HtrA2/Nma111 [Blastomyces gilchristii SLH14081]OAT12248.1 nuclear serine protease HtrA2/Nma111 [Blastomyces gilchristii SLH14081]
MPDWQATIEDVARSVVSVYFCRPKSFDTDAAASSQATGVLVDATNGHVVGVGPFRGYCVFSNFERCDATAVYRDPVHDFGFLKIDPTAIKHMSLEQLKLRPESAKPGVEIRVVGNDAGEKLTILQGTISRVDRNAPAATGATGGSSGSPVVNLTAMWLLYKQRAALIRRLHLIFCPLSGQSLASQSWEAVVRKAAPENTGMLVANIVLPEGPGDGMLQEGDVLAQVNNEMLTGFVRLDEILDSNVGNDIRLLVQQGGKDLVVSCTVHDLHKITPSRYVSIADGASVVISYQQLNNPHDILTDYIFLDRHWHPHLMHAARNDESGLWEFTNIAEPIPARDPVPQSAGFVRPDGTMLGATTHGPPPHKLVHEPRTVVGHDTPDVHG